jgi:hypothetical protein
MTHGALSRRGTEQAVTERRLRAMGVVVPAHNEETLIEARLNAIGVAASPVTVTRECLRRRRARRLRRSDRRGG